MNERDWDAVASRFEEEIFNVPANDRKRYIAGAVKRHADPTGTALDIGCGIGRTVKLLAKHFGRVIASDISSECLAIAAHVNRKVKNATYHHSDLIKAPPPGSPAEFALCINTLLFAEHRKRARMVEHVCASVKKGGHLVLVVPSIESVLLTHARHAEWKARASGEAQASGSEVSEGADPLRGVVCIDAVPTKHWSADELVSLLAVHGLEVRDVRKIEYPWSTEFDRPPGWMKGPYPWDWFVEARKG
jgi:SAM-dependent methyltransferase